MHHDIILLLDTHLAEMHTLRMRLAAPRPVRPGERWAAAVETARSAERYAAAVDDLLGLAAAVLPPPAEPAAALDAELSAV
ncbi:hypothetical protein ACFFX1_00980 [Dactylosporangium sucinum]|uniref:Uncharacterized protein n=1 Tax=Dactylosporangium sucinum TaxID=1424081 RepID=A0A917WQV9_9ACTN|nr:hypothetical protein [Dactylosporangium sucinum]GGM22080.1 hypothetical protein GCM10007977_024050 [Dactylosporangium sucinum]